MLFLITRLCFHYPVKWCPLLRGWIKSLFLPWIHEKNSRWMGVTPLRRDDSVRVLHWKNWAQLSSLLQWFFQQDFLNLSARELPSASMAALGAKYWKAVTRSHEEDEMKTIRDRLNRRIREPDHVTSKSSKVQQGSKQMVDVHSLRTKLSAKLKKRSISHNWRSGGSKLVGSKFWDIMSQIVFTNLQHSDI